MPTATRGNHEGESTGSVNPLDYLYFDPLGLKVSRVPSIGGFGLFSESQFRKNAFICNYRGIENPNAESSPYVYQFGYKNGRLSCVDASCEQSGVGRYINDVDPFHTQNCKPCVYEYEDNGKTKAAITIYSTRDIEIGE